MNLTRQDWRAVGIGALSATTVCLWLWCARIAYQDHVLLQQVVAYLNAQSRQPSPDNPVPTPLPNVQKAEPK